MEAGFEDQTNFDQWQETAPHKVDVKRLVMWFLGNIVIWIPAYYWLIEQNVYATNYCIFVVWIHFLCSLAVFDKKVCKELQKEGPSVNVKFNLGIDCVCGLILATFGFYFYAALYIVGSMFQAGAYHCDT